MGKGGDLETATQEKKEEKKTKQVRNHKTSLKVEVERLHKNRNRNSLSK